MVSPELLRRYPVFGVLNDAQLRAIAMVAAEKSFPSGAVIFNENVVADKLYIVTDGDVDLLYSGGGEAAVANAPVGAIASGEIFGGSSLLEPYRYIDTAQCAKTTQVVEIDAAALRALCEVDHHLGLEVMRHILQAALERLKYTQIELAAARMRSCAALPAALLKLARTIADLADSDQIQSAHLAEALHLRSTATTNEAKQMC
jgi:CRP-like cAMP-binding protein